MDQSWSKWTKWIEFDQSGSYGSIRPIWTELDLNGLKWAELDRMDRIGLMWTKMD